MRLKILCRAQLCFLKIAQAGWDLMVFVLFSLSMQCLRPLGYCAPLAQLCLLKGQQDYFWRFVYPKILIKEMENSKAITQKLVLFSDSLKFELCEGPPKRKKYRQGIGPQTSGNHRAEVVELVLEEGYIVTDTRNKVALQPGQVLPPGTDGSPVLMQVVVLDVIETAALMIFPLTFQVPTQNSRFLKPSTVNRNTVTFRW